MEVRRQRPRRQIARVDVIYIWARNLDDADSACVVLSALLALAMSSHRNDESRHTPRRFQLRSN